MRSLATVVSFSASSDEPLEVGMFRKVCDLAVSGFSFSEMVRILIWLFLLLRLSNAWINQNKAVEDVILKKYDSRHRPVKQESATLNIQVYLMINHIEKVVSQRLFG